MTGALIASYTVVDRSGVRKAGSALGFAVWLTIGDGVVRGHRGTDTDREPDATYDFKGARLRPAALAQAG
jgi:hypothetical protein